MTGLVVSESKVTSMPMANSADLIQRWVAFAQVKPASVKAYTKGAKNFLGYMKVNGISNITREVLISYRAFLGEKYKAASANLYLTATKLFVTFLYQEKIIGVDAAQHVKGFKVSEQHAKDALSAETTKKIIGGFDTSTLKGKRDAAIYAAMTTCGLRCVEVMRANVADMVNRGEKIFLYVQGKGRDDKAECVEIPRGVYNLINGYLAERGKVGSDAPLFASVSHRNFGGRLTTTSISRIIKGIFRANGIDSPRVTAHSLRHTCATVMIEAGHPLRQVQEVMRHKNITVTQRYLHELDRFTNGGESICAAAFGL